MLALTPMRFASRRWLMWARLRALASSEGVGERPGGSDPTVTEADDTRSLRQHREHPLGRIRRSIRSEREDALHGSRPPPVGLPQLPRGRVPLPGDVRGALTARA